MMQPTGTLVPHTCIDTSKFKLRTDEQMLSSARHLQSEPQCYVAGNLFLLISNMIHPNIFGMHVSLMHDLLCFHPM